MPSNSITSVTVWVFILVTRCEYSQATGWTRKSVHETHLCIQNMAGSPKELTAVGNSFKLEEQLKMEFSFSIEKYQSFNVKNFVDKSY